MPDLTPEECEPWFRAYVTEHYKHWYREVIAGVLALGAGLFDAWVYGRDRGLTSSLDELLIITGVGLIAGFPGWVSGKGKSAATESTKLAPDAGEPISPATTARVSN